MSEFQNLDNEWEDFDDTEGDEDVYGEGDLSEEYEGESFDEWYDSQGNPHEIHYEEMDNADAEYRQVFQTYEEASNYVYGILYGADQYFDIYYTEYGYEIFYMGGSD